MGERSGAKQGLGKKDSSAQQVQWGKEGMVEQEVETAGGDSTEELKTRGKMATTGIVDTIKPHSWSFVKGQSSSVLKSDYGSPSFQDL